MTWIVVSEGTPWFRVNLGDCPAEHAQSVLDQLLVEPTAPSDLALLRDDQPPAPRGFIRRLLRR